MKGYQPPRPTANPKEPEGPAHYYDHIPEAHQVLKIVKKLEKDIEAIKEMLERLIECQEK